MDQQQIGKFIAECRKEKGLTQSQLAEMLGVSDKSISRWENGNTMFDYTLYEPLCEILDIQITELLYGKRMSNEEKTIQGNKTALHIFKTKTYLKILKILSDILIIVGILLSGIIFNVLYDHMDEVSVPLVVTVMICGLFAYTFGIMLRIEIGKAIKNLED